MLFYFIWILRWIKTKIFEHTNIFSFKQTLGGYCLHFQVYNINSVKKTIVKYFYIFLIDLMNIISVAKMKKPYPIWNAQNSNNACQYKLSWWWLISLNEFGFISSLMENLMLLCFLLMYSMFLEYINKKHRNTRYQQNKNHHPHIFF